MSRSGSTQVNIGGFEDPGRTAMMGFNQLGDAFRQYGQSGVEDASRLNQILTQKKSLTDERTMLGAGEQLETQFNTDLGNKVNQAYLDLDNKYELAKGQELVQYDASGKPTKGAAEIKYEDARANIDAQAQETYEARKDPIRYKNDYEQYLIQRGINPDQARTEATAASAKYDAPALTDRQKIQYESEQVGNKAVLENTLKGILQSQKDTRKYGTAGLTSKGLAAAMKQNAKSIEGNKNLTAQEAEGIYKDKVSNLGWGSGDNKDAAAEHKIVKSQYPNLTNAEVQNLVMTNNVVDGVMVDHFRKDQGSLDILHSQAKALSDKKTLAEQAAGKSVGQTLQSGTAGISAKEAQKRTKLAKALFNKSNSDLARKYKGSATRKEGLNSINNYINSLRPREVNKIEEVLETSSKKKKKIIIDEIDEAAKAFDNNVEGKSIPFNQDDRALQEIQDQTTAELIATNDQFAEDKDRSKQRESLAEINKRRREAQNELSNRTPSTVLPRAEPTTPAQDLSALVRKNATTEVEAITKANKLEEASKRMRAFRSKVRKGKTLTKKERAEAKKLEEVLSRQ